MGSGRRWTADPKRHGKRRRRSATGEGETPHLTPNVPPPPPGTSNSVRAPCLLSDHTKGQRRPVDRSISPSEEARRRADPSTGPEQRRRIRGGAGGGGEEGGGAGK